VVFSNYENGDVAHRLDQPPGTTTVSCDIGMATAAAFFPIGQGKSSGISITLPLMDASSQPAPKKYTSTSHSYKKGWREHLAQTTRLKVPDEEIQFLYDAAVRTMLLLSAQEAYPGPYTYKRFWFRDACLMMHALLGLGLSDRVQRMLQRFPERQTLLGYFQSQQGEWDSNGQVLWIAGRLYELTDCEYDKALVKSLMKGAEWIINKRLEQDTGKPHQGLLPAGFSAEHLGPNDYYYWDNFWGVAGLQAAARLAGKFYSREKKNALTHQADLFLTSIMGSIEKVPEKNARAPSRPHPIAAWTRVPSAPWWPTIHCSCWRRATP
jgi:hypothetical protein